MQNQSTPAPIAPRNGVVALFGFGIRVGVERGHLVVEDGIGRDRRSGQFSRITRDLKRLVVIGHTGTISLDALRWLRDIGASFTQIDADGNVIVASGPTGLNDARLRRAQALAATNGIGMAIARDLLHRKVLGQLTILGHLTTPTDDASERLLEALNAAETADQLRIIESEAARDYWQAWSTIPLTFAKKDTERVPEHWRSFGSRTSPLTASPRSAANPANALLNYLYAILEAEARIAALAVGLDPGMGVLHADQRRRDSLACDLMEAVRPQVDAFVLEMLQHRTFRARDFFENRQGVCRVLPPLTKHLAETAPRWARAIAPIAEWVAKTLFESDGIVRTRDTRKKIATPLTETNRSAGRDDLRRKGASTAKSISLPPVCAGCGAPLADPQRHYCDACLPEHEAEKLAVLLVKGPATLARLRAEGRDPSKTPEALRKNSEKMIAQRRAAQEWE